MMRTKLRKLLRRLIVWALAEDKNAEVVCRGVSAGIDPRVIINTIRRAKITREL